LVLVADDLRGDVVFVEDEPIIEIGWQCCRRNVRDEIADGVDVVGQVQCCHVDVCRGPAQVVCRQQDAAFEDELVVVR
jgi:hypothetical protein